MKIYLATNNRHKLEELQNILTEHEILLPEDCNIKFDFEENGKTYFENSFGKAKALYDIVKAPVIADDSGLSVEALNGAPGIYTARYGDTFNNKLSQKEKNALIIKELTNNQNRNASFICCLTLILNNNKFITVQESFDGEIALSPSGTNGFGYDPIFKLKDKNITVAQLTEKEKNSISHRAKAALKLNKILAE